MTKPIPISHCLDGKVVEDSITKDVQRPYFHELPQSGFERLLVAKKTWDYIMLNFKQPEWCTYPDALAGQMGCWSLVDRSEGNKVNETFCSNCDCNKNYKDS